MKAVAEETRMTGLERSLGDAYREKRSRDDPRWLVEIRQAGMDRFRDMGFPTVHDEAWRDTNVAPIRQVPFQLKQLLLPFAAGGAFGQVGGRVGRGPVGVLQA